MTAAGAATGHQCVTLCCRTAPLPQVYIFGGIDAHSVLQADMWVYDLESQQWHQLLCYGQVSGPLPPWLAGRWARSRRCCPRRMALSLRR